MSIFSTFYLCFFTAKQVSIDKMHIRHILFYELPRGSTDMKTVKNVCEVYGEDAVKIRMCYKWFKKFRSGDFCLDDSLAAYLAAILLICPVVAYSR
ncbi:hypothetical protein WH47_04080 [Habropoda laboriosa]|uniref:Mos1 transposase HTH domain-containing protein n=1 Tax=Habropoda laboriosa TaxID=597456 RepID=A0A0L7QJA3_9HYME|nr:hypothetical protein WH47_04080 [Habropoda laboriosa]